MKAIIPAAGLGTRFYPLAKSISKEMPPIGNKPAIQHIVEEAVAAGAEEVIIVTSPEKPALQHYFTPFAGSGGVILGVYEDDSQYESLVKAMSGIGCTTIKPVLQL